MAPGLGGRGKGPEHRWLVFAVLALVPWGNEPGTNVPWAFDMGLKRPLCCRRPCTCNGNGPAWQSIAARAEGPCGTRFPGATHVPGPAPGSGQAGSPLGRAGAAGMVVSSASPRCRVALVPGFQGRWVFLPGHAAGVQRTPVCDAPPVIARCQAGHCGDGLGPTFAAGQLVEPGRA